MPVDFTVVVAVRQRFGDEKDDEVLGQPGLETDAPFVGRQKDFPFQCPNVDASQPAMLLFQSQGVHVRQPMTINGQIVFGGIPTSVDVAPSSASVTGGMGWARWNGNVMLVTPGVLTENNVLHIGTRENVDDFIVDNVVILFKTRGGVTPPLGRK